MRSRVLGALSLDDAGIAADVARILAFSGANEIYSEFRIGNWRTFVLWNVSGDDDDGTVLDTPEEAQVVPRAFGLGAVNELVRRTFRTDHLRLVRAHVLEDGVLVPHRDFVELVSSQWTRVHIPLQTNAGCLHSEDDSVFHMRYGEVWYLDASHTHSACNLENEPRVSLCLDFDLADADISSIFNPGVGLAERLPTIIEREPLDPVFLNGLHALADVINPTNFRDVVNLLARVHFYKDVDINEFYAWITEIARRSRNESIARKANDLARFMSLERTLGERFAL